MKLEKEFTLLKEYLGYFVNLKYCKETYLIRLKEWDGHGPKPRLDFRNEKDVEPLSFKDWINYYNKDKN